MDRREQLRDTVAHAIWEEMQRLAPHIDEPLPPDAEAVPWSEAPDDGRYLVLCLAEAAVTAGKAWEAKQRQSHLLRMVAAMPGLPDGMELIVTPGGFDDQGEPADG